MSETQENVVKLQTAIAELQKQLKGAFITETGPLFSCDCVGINNTLTAKEYNFTNTCDTAELPEVMPKVVTTEIVNMQAIPKPDVPIDLLVEVLPCALPDRNTCPEVEIDKDNSAEHPERHFTDDEENGDFETGFWDCSTYVMGKRVRYRYKEAIDVCCCSCECASDTITVYPVMDLRGDRDEDVEAVKIEDIDEDIDPTQELTHIKIEWPSETDPDYDTETITPTVTLTYGSLVPDDTSVIDITDDDFRDKIFNPSKHDVYGWLTSSNFNMFGDPSSAGTINTEVTGTVRCLHKDYSTSGATIESVTVHALGWNPNTTTYPPSTPRVAPNYEYNPDFRWYLPVGCPVRVSSKNMLGRYTIVEAFIPEFYGTLASQLNIGGTDVDRNNLPSVSVRVLQDLWNTRPIRDCSTSSLAPIRWWWGKSGNSITTTVDNNNQTQTVYTTGAATITAYASPLFCKNTVLPAGTRVQIKWFYQYNRWIIVAHDCCN